METKQAWQRCVCVVFISFLSFPLNLVIILHRAERKPSVAGESILTRQLSKPLGTGGHRGEPHHRWRPRRPDCWEADTVCAAHCTQELLRHAHTHTRKHTQTNTRTHTPAWVVLLPWQPVIDPLSYAVREGILMTESKQRLVEDGERWRGGWESC